MATNDGNVRPPFGPPDIDWVKPSATATSLPDGSVICGDFDGTPMYAGRFYHQQELLIGSILTPGTCIYSKDGNVHRTSDYEILTAPCSDPLAWGKVTPGEPLPADLVDSGQLKNGKILHVGRIVIGNNALTGWVCDKELHVFEDEKEKVFTEFEILVHKYLKFLCICPPRPCPKSDNA